MNTNNDEKGAAVKFPPPLISLLSMIAAYGIHHFYPIGIGSSPGLEYLGVILAISGICIVVAVGRLFKQTKTNIEPWKPTTTIISTGLYAYSRNPIYVAFSLVPIGIGLFLNSFWILISFLPSTVLVYYIAIKKEELYLEQKFGEEYLAYKQKVRRWL